MILAVFGLLVPTLFSFLVELQQHSPITAEFRNRSIDQNQRSRRGHSFSPLPLDSRLPAQRARRRGPELVL
jgi:hypothetical protein